MARAKQTGRSEARRRYRQTTAPLGANGDAEILEPDDDEPARRAAKTVSGRPTDNRAPSGRVGFGAAFRLAYHPPHIVEDIRTLPSTLMSRGFLAAVLMVIGGGVLWFVYPVYSGSITAWELLVLPGSALAPQLVAGFFAPRASYLLGFFVGLVQPVVYLLVNSSARVQEAYIARGVSIPGITVEEVGLAFLNSIVMGALFAAMAAWYRRFLALSSQRGAAGRSSASKTPSKSTPRRSASR